MGLKFCPKCKSENVIMVAGGNIGMFECYKCKFRGSIFPEKTVKNQSSIKAVIFDIGGVLMVGSEQMIKKGKKKGFYEEMAKGLNTELNLFLDALSELFVKSTEGNISKRKFIILAAKRLGISEKEFMKKWNRTLKKHFRLNKELLRYALKIRKLGFRIGILSDQDSLSRDQLVNKKFTKFFDPVIISCDVKMKKPQPRIYNLLLKKLKLQAKEIIFVDNRDYNLIPSRKLGIKSVLHKNNKDTINKTNKLLKISI